MPQEPEEPQFEWDPHKAQANLDKHDVSFDEAATVFADRLARIQRDALHSDYESRNVIIGHSALSRLLFVCFVEREPRLRIVSARKATRLERKSYESDAHI